MKCLGPGTARSRSASRGSFVIVGAGGTLKKYTVKCKHHTTVLSTKLTPDASSADCHLQIYK